MSDDYLERRKLFNDKYSDKDLWEIVDHWPLLCGIQNLARYIAIYELYKKTLDVPGHIAEFGSWKGANLMFLTKLKKIFDFHGHKKIHCFDSFEGLKTFDEHDAEAVINKDKYQGNLDVLKEVMQLYEVEDDVVIHKGDILKILSTCLDKQKELSFSFVYCDVDLHEPTIEILKNIHPRLSKNGLIVLDEWNYAEYPGETVAAREFLEEYNGFYEVSHVKNAKQPSLVLKKIK